MSFEIWRDTRIGAVLTYGQALRVRHALNYQLADESFLMQDEHRKIVSEMIDELDLVLAAAYGKLRQAGFEAEYPPSREDKRNEG